jgi:CRISPR-associated exonuclease Cas4
VLIHGEQQWAENRLTAEGRLLHHTVDEPGEEWRGAVRVAHAVRLVHRGLRLIGVADVVEFHRQQQEGPPVWQPFPVEYKRGRPKEHNADKIQLCAQALCLEEIFSLPVPAGALFYGQPRRRQDVAFDAALRQQTTEVITAARAALAAAVLPKPLVADPRCQSCSLVDICCPALASRSAQQWLQKTLAALLAPPNDERESL